MPKTHPTQHLLGALLASLLFWLPSTAMACTISGSFILAAKVLMISLLMLIFSVSTLAFYFIYRGMCHLAPITIVSKTLALIALVSALGVLSCNTIGELFGASSNTEHHHVTAQF